MANKDASIDLHPQPYTAEEVDTLLFFQFNQQQAYLKSKLPADVQHILNCCHKGSSIAAEDVEKFILMAYDAEKKEATDGKS